LGYGEAGAARLQTAVGYRKGTLSELSPIMTLMCTLPTSLAPLALIGGLKALLWTARYGLLLCIAFVELAFVGYFCLKAYRIRCYSVREFGYIIHEFDPWFNYRAAEYLAQHGSEKFFKWYDYMSWYPIGRPVGTTIYPGMQFAAYWIWQFLQRVPRQKFKIPYKRMGAPKWLEKYVPNDGKPLPFGPMSVNDICVMIPPWFAAVTTAVTGLMTRELSESTGAGVVASFFMSIIPAHIQRTYSGEFENEAVAILCFCSTIWLWALSIRTQRHWPFGILAGVAYFCAAASWGGYIFINNLIALHAALLVVVGKRSRGLYKAFTLYYLVGTYLAMRIPVIGFAPLRAAEQLPSVLVFLTYQLMHVCDIYRATIGKEMTGWQFFRFRALVFGFMVLLALLGAYAMFLRGVFMPLGARIRGLFMDAQKTGNPLVDSVTEHQPATYEAYAHHLGWPRYWAVLGLVFAWHQATPAKLIAPIYAAVAYHYSLKMARLMVICGPIVSCLAAYPAGIVLDWCLEQFLGLLFVTPQPTTPEVEVIQTGGMGSIVRTLKSVIGPMVYCEELQDFGRWKESARAHLPFLDRPLRAALALAIIYEGYEIARGPVESFKDQCEKVGISYASPQLMWWEHNKLGHAIMVRDYYDGYMWLGNNTRPNARVIAWWDYGYQITGVANRTTLVDGNTWNHEHIATVGRILSSVEKKSWNAQRHLADYALVWTADMGKAAHFARIANSVYPEHCGDDDPMCNRFGFNDDGTPTPWMADSFVYKAVHHKMKPGVELNPKYFKEVHTTKYGYMRIYKVRNISRESRDWVEDPANKLCDAPGSWYCVGQYPPALKPLIEKKRNFKQLEDFNRQDGEKSAYTKHIEAERERR